MVDANAANPKFANPGTNAERISAAPARQAFGGLGGGALTIGQSSE
jgi:hypothetical protein